jgi:hypothetical protein
MKYLAGLVPLLALVAADATPAHAWKCCDQWGYRWHHLTKSGCTNDGGNVTYEDECPGGQGLPFKCCTTEGVDVPNFVAETRHECAAEGGIVHADVYQCPGDQNFVCCDAEAGEEVDGYANAQACTDAGHSALPFALFGCRLLGAATDIKAAVASLDDGYHCAKDVAAYYTEPEATSIAAVDWPDSDPLWTDNHTHCTTSCLIASRCGRFWSTIAGFGKEALDMCDDEYGNSWGWGDACSNRVGRNFGVDLDGASDDVERCLEYCTVTNDAFDACGDGELGATMSFLVDLLQQPTGVALADELKAALLDALMQVFNDGPDSKILDLCYSILDNFGLVQTQPTGEALADLETSARELIAFVVSQLGDAEIAQVAPDTIVQALGDQRYLIVSHVANRDIYLEVGSDSVASIQIRGSTGRLISMVPSQLDETACSTPPCAKRVPWLEWRASAAPSAVIR